VIQLHTAQLIHLQNTFTTKYIDINIHLNNTATTLYDYASTQKSVTFTKDSMTKTIEVSSTSADEGDRGIQSTTVNVTLSSKLDEDIVVDLSSGDSVTIPAGATSATGKVAWGSDIVDRKVDSDAPIDVSITDFYYFGSEDVVIGHGGEVVIIDDDSFRFIPEIKINEMNHSKREVA